ncbi:MAG: LysR family transcriptional regulator [Ectothiorhodospiraceae bacterium]|jgi:LysR family nitrogen assimilation transcriptional regulator
MDIRQLRYFLAIAEARSITGAAERLGVAQSALSQQLRRLEQALDTRLLVRSSRGVRLTETGERLRQHARQLVQDLDGLREEIRSAESSPSGPVSIGIPTSLGSRLSVPLALRVRRELPRVKLHVVEGLSGHTLQWLRAGTLDLALVFGAESVPGLTVELIATEELHLVGPSGDATLHDTREDTVPLSALGRLPLVMPARPHGVREELEAAARAAGVQLDVVLEMDALEPIKALVAEGAGYTVLSPRLAREGPLGRRLETRLLGPPPITRSIYLAREAERPLSIGARHVRDRLRAELARLTRHQRWRDFPT